MAKALARLLVLVALLVHPLLSPGAETVKLRHVLSVYNDEKGVGLKKPEGVACSEKSFVIVADTENGRLLRYVFQDKDVKERKEIKVPEMLYPTRVQINSKGEILVLDEKQRRILRLSPEGQYQGYLTAEGLPSPSTFVPRSFKIDAKDNIYVLDVFSGRVLILSPDGKYQKHLDVPKGEGFLSDLAVDFRGNVLLLDSVKLIVYGAAKDATAFAPLGAGLKGYVHFPTSLTTDSRGTLYVVDESGAGVAILAPDGSFIGRQLSMGWTEGFLYFPAQMCLTEKGDAFIADRGNSRLQIFSVSR